MSQVDLYDVLEAAVTPSQPAVAVFGNGVFAGVVRQLVGSGIPLLEVLAWAKKIYEVIRLVGSDLPLEEKIKKVFEIITGAMNDGKTPETFTPVV